MANGICVGSSHYTRPTTTKLARTWDWARMRRYAGPCNAPERLPPHQSYLGYTIVTRGSDFRERQGFGSAASPAGRSLSSCAKVGRSTFGGITGNFGLQRRRNDVCLHHHSSAPSAPSHLGRRVEDEILFLRRWLRTSSGRIRLFWCLRRRRKRIVGHLLSPAPSARSCPRMGQALSQAACPGRSFAALRYRVFALGVGITRRFCL
jgi:hypothetical protein